MVGPNFITLYGLQDLLRRFGVVPKAGFKRDLCFLVYFFLSGIDVKDASSGTPLCPSSLGFVLLSYHKYSRKLATNYPVFPISLMPVPDGTLWRCLCCILAEGCPDLNYARTEITW